MVIHYLRMSQLLTLGLHSRIMQSRSPMLRKVRVSPFIVKKLRRLSTPANLPRHAYFLLFFTVYQPPSLGYLNTILLFLNAQLSSCMLSEFQIPQITSATVILRTPLILRLGFLETCSTLCISK